MRSLRTVDGEFHQAQLVVALAKIPRVGGSADPTLPRPALSTAR